MATLQITQFGVEDATSAVESIIQAVVDGGHGEDELRARLTEGGFEGDCADVDDIGEAGFRVRCWGPNNTIIDV